MNDEFIKARDEAAEKCPAVPGNKPMIEGFKAGAVWAAAYERERASKLVEAINKAAWLTTKPNVITHDELIQAAADASQILFAARAVYLAAIGGVK